jgi:hypothetical protein
VSKNQIKTAGIPRTGFEYQDLIGIEVMLKFYRNPDLFDWIKLEADDPQVGKLDDVVAARKDGSFELMQVKFTVDTQKYLLDWDWLLKKKKKGTSLLQKWSHALTTTKSLGSIRSAKLRTNRQPSSAFQISLDGHFVDFDKIANDQKTKLSLELGNEATARDFFKQFEFSHSEQGVILP